MNVNDLLHLVPGARAYADDLTVTASYGPEEEAATMSRLQYTLSRVVAWGNLWQVKFAPQKTQLLSVSRTDAAPHLSFNGETLLPQEEVNVLGVTYDRRLTFKTHIERLARETAGKLASL